MTDKNTLPIPKGFASWLEWELADGDDRNLWHEYIDAGLTFSRQDIRDAVQAELDNLKALAKMSDKQMTLDDLIDLIKLDIKKLSNADGYYDLDNKYVVSGIITGLNDAIKHITDNRDALERGIKGVNDND